MKNKLLSPANAMATITIIAALLGTTKESLAQNLASNEKIKAQTENTNGITSNANSLAYNNPLAFAQQNIQDYFPNQESIQQTNFLINRLGTGTIRDEVTKLLIEHIVNNISDPKQQIWTIVFSLERYVFGGDREVTNIFSKNNQSREVANFKAAMKFGTAFMDRYKSNLEQMIKNIEQGEERIKQGEERIKQGEERIKQGEERIKQGEKRLEENRIRIEKLMSFVTPEMVKSDEKIKKLVIERQQRYIDLNQTPDNPHIISLFEALN